MIAQTSLFAHTYTSVRQSWFKPYLEHFSCKAKGPRSGFFRVVFESPPRLVVDSSKAPFRCVSPARSRLVAAAFLAGLAMGLANLWEKTAHLYLGPYTFHRGVPGERLCLSIALHLEA
jgi:hypothetical protein